MKILTLIFTFTLIFQLKAHANTNISHAIAMHGEPKVPAAERIDIDDDGNIVGLF